jgi:hypothetical protein
VLARKFPTLQTSETPWISGGGMVGSPISEDAAQKMSDDAWLGAFRKYSEGVRHRDLLKGGADELSRVLLKRVQEEPERFYRLALRTPSNADEAYASAFMQGIAEAIARAEWLFDVVRHFTQEGRMDLRRPISWAVDKRAAALPEDLVTLLESYAFGTPDPFEEREGDPYNRCMNSDRGSALLALLHTFHRQKGRDALNKRWLLVERVSRESSVTLRAGAVEELRFLLADDSARAVALFACMVKGHSVFLRSHYSGDFIHYAMHRHLPAVMPFIRCLMSDETEQSQILGAQLACLSALARGADGYQENATTFEAITDELLCGPVTWRRGAARVFAHNVADGPSDLCVQGLTRLVEDEDKEVQRTVGGTFRSLGTEHFFSLRQFLEAFASSATCQAEGDDLAEYLWEHGLLDPDWTLGLIEAMLNGETTPQQFPRMLTGSEHLIRLVLRIHTDPTLDDSNRKRAMDAFDGLMERYGYQAQKVLGEWDRL